MDLNRAIGKVACGGCQALVLSLAKSTSTEAYALYTTGHDDTAVSEFH